MLSREDTRNLAREWLVEHVPPRTKIVVEPVVPDAWAQDIGNPSRLTSNGNRWVKYPTSRSRIDPDNPDGPLLPPPGAVVHIEDFERMLVPELVDDYDEQGYCWVVVGSTQRGRAEAEPDEVPSAIAYYRKLERELAAGLRGLAVRARRATRSSSTSTGRSTTTRWPTTGPGPVMSIYRLTAGRCAG